MKPLSHPEIAVLGKLLNKHFAGIESVWQAGSTGCLELRMYEHEVGLDTLSAFYADVAQAAAELVVRVSARYGEADPHLVLMFHKS